MLLACMGNNPCFIKQKLPQVVTAPLQWQEDLIPALLLLRVRQRASYYYTVSSYIRANQMYLTSPPFPFPAYVRKLCTCVHVAWPALLLSGPNKNSLQTVHFYATKKPRYRDSYKQRKVTGRERMP